MIIEDKWDAKEKGFKFTYIRNTITLIFSRQLIRSISSGIAKPADW